LDKKVKTLSVNIDGILNNFQYGLIRNGITLVIFNVLSFVGLILLQHGVYDEICLIRIN